MKSPIKFIVLLVGLIVINLTSCQKEVVEETPPNQEETIAPNSSLAIAMRNTSANDGSVDNIMDGSDCFTVNLPVTIEANGITLTIQSLDDLSLIEAIFDVSNTDEDSVDFLFPITIILNDYTEVNIESLEELEAFIETCVANEDIIECVDFVYPVSFSIYNSDFQIIDTIEVDNDYEMYIFLEGLENGNQGAVLASLNFPVSLMYVNGNTVEVASNQELEEAINAASENCDADCTQEEVDMYLQECQWVIASYNSNNEFENYLLSFNANQELQILNGSTTQFIEGVWSTSLDINGELIISISDINDTVLNEQLGREWSVVVCSENRFELISGQDIMVLEQDCEENPFNCFGDVNVTACDFDNNGFGVFELETLILGNVICNVDFTSSFHETLVDAESATNPIATPEAYQSVSDTIYLRIENLSGDFEVFVIQLIVENCDCSNPGILTDDLVIYMPFSTEIKDLISGYSLNTFTNEFVEDRDGNPTCAIAFSNNNPFEIPVTVQNQLVQGDNFSVSIWFKMQNTDVGNYEAIFQKGEAVTEGFQIGVYDLNTPVASDTTFGYGLWDDDWNQEVDVQWDNTDWHHLVITRDSNNTIRLYRDGILRNIDENSDFDIDTAPLENYILGQFFQGHLDDLRVYKRTLSDNEVGDLFNLEADCYTCL